MLEPADQRIVPGGYKYSKGGPFRPERERFLWSLVKTGAAPPFPRLCVRITLVNPAFLFCAGPREIWQPFSSKIVFSGEDGPRLELTRPQGVKRGGI